MKTKHIFLVSLLALSVMSCSDHFLDRNPAGGVISEDQYNSIPDHMEGSLRGIYTMLYAGTSDHDVFGVKSIDIQTDILSSDMALTGKNYGWFFQDEQLSTASGRTGYYWSFYYGILHNINQVIRMLKADENNVIALVARYGLPTDPECEYKYTDDDKENGYFYAVALALRGYVYAKLAEFYIPVPSALMAGGMTLDTYPSIILYNDENMDKARGLSFGSEVYDQIESDFTSSIDYFTAFAAGGTRKSKNDVDINVAKGLMAYALLNKASYYTNDETMRTAILNKAITAATEVIASGEYQIIPKASLYATGFNDLSSTSWVWGQKVTIENAPGLNSFFGQVDIHSYSYAWAGDQKKIDLLLRQELQANVWDGREGWFFDTNDKFDGCPVKKFYSAANPTSTADVDLDRQWLSDNVYMRIESMYLIAAEAYFDLMDYTKAAQYLNDLTDQRVVYNPELIASQKRMTEDEVTAAYDAYKNTLTDASALQAAIYYNWRVEMWGEGYGLRTFLRLGDTKRRGGNHANNAGSEVKPGDAAYQFPIPSSETTYNPNL